VKWSISAGGSAAVRSTRVASISALAASALVLAACTGGPSDESTTGGGTTGDSDTQKPVTLQVWHTESNPATVAALDEIIADFESIHPNITVEQEGVGWDDLSVKLTTALEAGAPPAISQVQPIVARTFIDSGVLVPIDELFDQIGLDNIIPDVRDISLRDGHRYGLAHAWGTRMLFYNVAKFRDAGVEPPTSYSEWVEAARKLAASGTYGFTMPGGRLFVNLEFWMALASNGGYFFDDDGNPTLTSKPVIETLEFFRDLLASAPAGWAATAYPDTYVQLTNGTVASISGVGRGILNIEQNVDAALATPDNFSVFERPVGPSGTHPVMELDAEQWVVYKDAHPAEALEFLKFLYQPKNYLKYVLSVPTQLLPVTLSTLEDPEYKSNALLQKWDPVVQTMWDDLEAGYAKPYFTNRPEDLDIPYLAQLEGSDIIPTMFSSVVVDGVDPAVAAQTAQDAAEQLVERARR